MENDDRLVGRILTRREALGLVGAAGIGLLTNCGGNGMATSGNGTTTGTSAGSSTVKCV